ncbi:flavodoxin family protein [Clostridium estertheticum]|uniref:flavodoxin family protein n=1 Tax=Clostridium estertheticum TaxID=238834 RepID=UPI000A035CE3|nr:flavodoxin family protein [Clostridium estertheticum]MBZ9613993.1 flavodoxin family protein [Clostridium estertheticum subsp. laramiense]WAG73949.1 flavodoxin family protein [Clostridium estertheticum]
MKPNVYCFAGTGNSLTVAKDIAKEIEGVLISIPYVIGHDIIKTDAKVVVIIFPVYMWGIPLIIERFIKNFKILMINTFMQLRHMVVCLVLQSTYLKK